MLDQVLPADVEDESDLRPQCSNVRKVLFGSHSDIRALAFPSIGQIGEHALESALIRYKIVGAEGSAGFGEFRDHRPERLIRKLDWKLFGGPRESEQDKEA